MKEDKPKVELWENIIEVVPPWALGPENEDKIKDSFIKAYIQVGKWVDGIGKMPPIVEYNPNLHLIMFNVKRKAGLPKQIPTTCFAMTEDGRVWRLAAIGTKGAPKDVSC